MPYIIKGGVPVRVGISPPEVTVAPEFEIVTQTVDDRGTQTVAFLCPECGKTYKTETGLDNHIASKH